MILAGVFKAPGLILTDDEARQLATATCDVSRHYNVQATQKTIDWVNLITAATLIYGTRVMAASKRKKEAREHAQAPHDQGPIIQFPGSGRPVIPGEETVQ